MGQSAYKPQYTPFGSLFEPLFFRKDGRPVYPILGGAPDGDESDAGQSAGEEGAEKDDRSEDGSGDEGSGDGTEGQDAGSGEAVSREDFERIKRQLQAADRRREAAESKVKEFERANLSELEKATTEVKELKDNLVQRDQTIQDLRLELAFFQSNKVQWHDPELARKHIDMDLVTVGDDGKIRGMDKALEKLAKEKPFLVKQDEKKTQPSGGSFNNGAGKKAATAVKDLAHKYPALRGRGGNTGS